MTCKTCGRDQNHWLGCAETLRPQPVTPTEDAPSLDSCDYPGCENAKASNSPRAKWCEFHKDPKARI